MRRKVNWKALAILVVGTAVVVTGAYFFHRRQVRKNATALRDQADAARYEGELAREINYLRQFLGFMPSDTDALERYGLLLANERVATSPMSRFRAITVLDQVLARDPERVKVREKVVELAMSIHRYREASEHLRGHLLAYAPQDAGLRARLGQCEDEMGRFKEARAAYEAAVERGASPETYFRLAVLLREHGLEVLGSDGREQPGDLARKADDLILNRMIQGGEASADYRAFLTRAEYLRLYRPAGLSDDARLRRIEADVIQAQKLGGKKPEVILALAELSLGRRDTAEARNLLTDGVKKWPENAKLWLTLAELESGDGDLGAAAAALRQGLKAVPGNLELLWALANVQLRLGEDKEAAETIASLRRAGVGVELRVLEARLHLNQEDFKQAAAALQEAMAGLLSQLGANRKNFHGALARQAGLLLGDCQEKQGQFDLAYDAYRQVVESVDPRSLEARAGMARTRRAAGRIDEAEAEYRAVAQTAGAPAAFILEFARLAVARQFGRESPDWAEAERAVSFAEQRLRPLPLEVIQLRLEVMSQQGRLAQAEDYLDNLVRPSLPTERRYDPLRPAPLQLPLAYYLAKAAVYDATARPALAARALAHAEAAYGASVEVRLARVNHLARQKGPEVKPRLLRLERDAATLTEAAERRQLLLALAAAHVRQADRAEAKRVWALVAGQWADDVPSRLALFELALQAGDEGEMEMDRLIEELEKSESKVGYAWRGAQLRQLVARAVRAKPKSAEREKALKQAQERLAELKRSRPAWSVGFLVQAQITDLRGDRKEALRQYDEAMRRGERSVEVLRRVFALRYSEGDLNKAFEIQRRLPADSLTGVLGRAAAEAALVGGDLDAARQHAEKEAAKSAKPEDHVWLATIYARSYGRDLNQRAKVEGAFREAIKRDGKSHAAWVGRVLYLAEFPEKEVRDDAKKVLGEAVEALKEKRDAYGALGMACEAVGDVANAEKFYAAALSYKATRTASNLHAAARFYLRQGRQEKAEALLHELKDLGATEPTEAAWAGQLLTVLKAGGGTYKEAQAALAGLGSPDGLPKDADAKAVGDQRARILILARQPGQKNRTQAIDLLNNLINRQKQIPTDYLILAALYEKDNKWVLAKRQYLELEKRLRDGAIPALVPLLRGLIRRGEVAEAHEALARLERAAPRLFVTAEMRARLLHAEKKTPEGLKVLEAALREHGQDVSVVLAAAAAYESMGQQTEAEKLYTQVVYGVTKGQQPLGLLVSYYTRQSEHRKALDVCEGAWKKLAKRSDAVDLCLLVLNSLQDVPEVVKRLDGQFAAARAQAPNDLSVAAAVGHLRVVQGRRGEALALYEEVLRAEPNKALTLNNLAWLLAQDPATATRALSLTDQAIDQVGPAAWLLDTRAIALLALGRAEEALKLLQEAVEEEPTPTTRFHLAQAHLALKDRAAAAAALKKALAEGLSIYPVERDALDKLKAELGMK